MFRPLGGFAIGAVCLALATAAYAGEGGPITVESLLRELNDLDNLAEFPEPPFTCRQFSSYDRASKSPEDAKGWFANADAGQFLRVDERDGRKEHVMMDADGPGAIVRIWSANPKGTLRIYLDEGETPTIEAPMSAWLGGTFAGVPVPLAGERSRGWNSYFPVPYARHCKVTSDEGGFYYHVNYRTYPAGTDVTTMQAEDFARLAPLTYELAAKLLVPGERAAPRGAKPTARTLQLAPGRSEYVDLGGGPGAIVSLSAQLTDGDPVEGLRSIVLELTFDDEKTVSAPLGDFYGAAPGINAYQSLPLGVTRDGRMRCNWVMPFEKSARLALTNTGGRPFTVQLEALTAARPWTQRSMHFHCDWKSAIDVPTRPMIDWNYLAAGGQGVFVGAAFNIANPVRAWWGEGDEKIYVDGESFPSHFGTGTEDYYGYAWCWPGLFSHAFHNQPRCDGPGNYGHTAVNRWHIVDRIPFTRDFRFDMELWHWHETCKVTMSVATYWYARPGAKSDTPRIEPAALALKLLGKYEPPRVAGAIEGETLRIVEKKGRTEAQGLDGCSGESHLWWTQAQPGDRLVLAFPAAAAGPHRVLIHCVKAGDYGIHKLTINEQPAGEPIDFYHAPGIAMSKEIDLGTFELKEGDNTLAVEVVGKNEKAAKGFMFGLDYIRLEAGAGKE